MSSLSAQKEGRVGWFEASSFGRLNQMNVDLQFHTGGYAVLEVDFATRPAAATLRPLDQLQSQPISPSIMLPLSHLTLTSL